jgi:hypothetical protein
MQTIGYLIPETVREGRSYCFLIAANPPFRRFFCSRHSMIEDLGFPPPANTLLRWQYHPANAAGRAPMASDVRYEG